MQSTDSLLSLNMSENEIILGTNLCAICHKIVCKFEEIKLSFIDDTLDETNELILNDMNNETILIVHKSCANLKYKRKSNNTNNNTLVDNTMYRRKYINNIKRRYFYLILLACLLITIIGISLYNCYYIFETEDNIINYQNCDCDVSWWFYKMHVVLVINLFVLLLVSILIFMRMILLIFK